MSGCSHYVQFFGRDAFLKVIEFFKMILFFLYSLGFNFYSFHFMAPSLLLYHFFEVI